MRLHRSLYTKILLWFFLNLIVLGVVFLVFFNLQFRFPPDSPLSAATGSRFRFVARLISDEFRAAPGDQRDSILRRYSASYQVEFILCTMSGEKLAGGDTPLPDKVRRQLAATRPFPFPPAKGSGPQPRGADDPGRPPSERFSFADRIPPEALRPDSIFTLSTTSPTRYWSGVFFPWFDQEQSRPSPAMLLAVSDSMTGHGLFFDPKPWIFVIATVLALSILLWLPFVRSLTISIRQMTVATERIAEEHFDTRVSERRSDELGRLGAAINQMASRLENFVGGQKRFLGGISHELNSPLARLQYALAILEERAGPSNASYIADAQEESRLMSQLVNELLAFARAGLKGAEPQLHSVRLLPLVRQVCAREAFNCEVKIEIDEEVAVFAQPDLLSRALANVLRNAARYAPGELNVAAQRQQDQVRIAISDRGPGVSPAALQNLFEPFYRLEADRARATGGTGLGLAIVKACVDACQGTVAARNLSPSGLEISILLRAA
jgi:two-component system, OmpR family, sensor histidine kinase CpxA